MNATEFLQRWHDLCIEQGAGDCNLCPVSDVCPKAYNFTCEVEEEMEIWNESEEEE